MAIINLICVLGGFISFFVTIDAYHTRKKNEVFYGILILITACITLYGFLNVIIEDFQ